MKKSKMSNDDDRDEVLIAQSPGPNLRGSSWLAAEQDVPTDQEPAAEVTPDL